MALGRYGRPFQSTRTARWRLHQWVRGQLGKIAFVLLCEGFRRAMRRGRKPLDENSLFNANTPCDEIQKESVSALGASLVYRGMFYILLFVFMRPALC